MPVVELAVVAVEW
jgi:hypothetical protein